MPICRQADLAGDGMTTGLNCTPNIKYSKARCQPTLAGSEYPFLRPKPSIKRVAHPRFTQIRFRCLVVLTDEAQQMKEIGHCPLPNRLQQGFPPRSTRRRRFGDGWKVSARRRGNHLPGREKNAAVYPESGLAKSAS